jgi:hypothetical protein
MVQLLPVQPATHLHEYDVTVLVQVAPFLHGLAAHLSVTQLAHEHTGVSIVNDHTCFEVTAVLIASVCPPNKINSGTNQIST